MVSLELYIKGESAKYYNLDFGGDRHFFNKNYGAFNPPAEFLDYLSSRVCEDYWYTYFQIIPDTVVANVNYSCLDNTDGFAFEKVETNIHFAGDKSKPEAMIQEALRNVSFKDSVYLLQTIVNREGEMHASHVLHGNDTAVTNLIFRTLERITGWKPALQGGRSVKAYNKVFIRVLPGKKIKVLFQHLR